MWKPYLPLTREKCSQALHILDRFHIVAKMNKALDEVRAAEARHMAVAGQERLLQKTRWCLSNAIRISPGSNGSVSGICSASI